MLKNNTMQKLTFWFQNKPIKIGLILLLLFNILIFPAITPEHILSTNHRMMTPSADRTQFALSYSDDFFGSDNTEKISFQFFLMVLEMLPIQ